VRVTNLTSERNFLFNIRDIESRLLELQNQASSGRLISRPQDDPVGTERSLLLNHHLAQSKQYLRNIDHARIFMDEREHAFSEMTSILSRVNELCLAAATSTTPDDARKAIAAELAELKEAAHEIAQRTVQGRKIMVGTLPSWEVSPNLTVTVDPLDSLMNDIDVTFEDLLTAVNDNDLETIRTISTKMNGLEDVVSAERSENGAREARLNILEERIGALDLEYQRLLSKAEEVDFTEVITKLKTAEASYSAALAVGATIIQPTLLDYLK
jgi:flagellar hook-associated protein 3 FlgL